MKVVRIESIQTNKLGTVVATYVDPNNIWYFIPGALFKVFKKAIRKPNLVIFTGYHNQDVVIDILKRAPTINPHTILDFSETISTTTTYVKKRNQAPKKVSPGKFGLTSNELVWQTELEFEYLDRR